MTACAKGELALINGNIVTLEKEQPQAEAVLIRNGYIDEVGSTQEILTLKSKAAEIIDLRGRTVLPGLVKSHAHTTMVGLGLLEVDCRTEVKSIADILERIKQKIKTTEPGNWILGGGYDDTKLQEKRHLTRWDLDSVAKEYPVFLKRTCLHMGVANSKALELAGITKDTADPPGGHIVRDPATGEPTGLLQEKAQDLLPIAPYTVEKVSRGLQLAMEQFARWGVTTVHDMLVDKTSFQAHQSLMVANELPIRARMWINALPALGVEGLLPQTLALGLQSGYGNDMLKFMGMKFVLDGSLGGQTAAVEEDYVGSPGSKGILYVKDEDLNKAIAESLKNNLRVAIHGIGERAIEQALRAVELAAQVVPLEKIRAMRNRIEHCSLPTKEQLQRIKKLGLVVGSSVGFIYHLGDSQKKALGEERVKRLYPHRTYIDMGIPAPGNCDCPVCEGNPLYSIYSTVARKTESGQVLGAAEAISVEEALAAYTVLGAYSACEDNMYGTIKVGKLADLVVFNENPLKVPTEEIKDLVTEMTFVGGRQVYSC